MLPDELVMLLVPPHEELPMEGPCPRPPTCVKLGAFCATGPTGLTEGRAGLIEGITGLTGRVTEEGCAGGRGNAGGGISGGSGLGNDMDENVCAEVTVGEKIGSGLTAAVWNGGSVADETSGAVAEENEGTELDGNEGDATEETTDNTIEVS